MIATASLTLYSQGKFMNESYESAYAYMTKHVSGEGWMVMARIQLSDAHGATVPFAPVGSPTDHLLPVRERGPKRFDEEGARKAIRFIQHEMSLGGDFHEVA